MAGSRRLVLIAARVDLPFTKMEGAGNDYIYIDGVARPLPDLDWPAVSRAVADRHRGVGSDGLILIVPGAGEAPFRMIMFNADGSRGAMCGNGVRCVAKFVHDAGYAPGPAFPVATDAGRVEVEVLSAAVRESRVRVDMGQPEWDPARIPFLGTVPPSGETELAVAGRTVVVTPVSMGNPHCVVFLDRRNMNALGDGDATAGSACVPGGSDETGAPGSSHETGAPGRCGAQLEDLPLDRIGPRFERHASFPERVNTEFVVVERGDSLHMRVWERGSGETWACGTGACAVLVAAARTGRADRRAVVHLRGGDLEVAWDEAGHVQLAGPAVEICRGTFPVDA